MENYCILEAIGEGSFGRVFRGKCLRTENIIALKFIPKRNKIEKELKSLRRECEIQQELFHPNIVRMIDAFETEGMVVAVSEYVPIQLCSLLVKHGTLPEDRVRSISCNLISAIYYLHSLRILHRDIKPQNILITTEGEAKLCDFGFSRKMGLNTYVLTSVKGTPLYMAPELIDEKPYDHTADLWSLGCILFELLTGKPPFCTTSIVQLITMIHQNPIIWPPNLSWGCRSFLEGLLQKEPNRRLTWPDLLKHPWVKDGIYTASESSVDPSHLIYPLSSSQEQIKEQQKKQLSKQGFFYPKLLKTLQKNENDSSFQNQGASNVPKNDKENPCSFVDVGQNFEMKVLKQTLESNPCCDKQHIDKGLDVRVAVGSSVRRLSTISHETGFKDEDVADFTSPNPSCQTENRKDSMINYLPNSVDSSKRGSRPSFTALENFTNSQLSNINEESCNKFEVLGINDKDMFRAMDNSCKLIEMEEWATFINKSLSEVMNENNFDLYYQTAEVNMFISPLQSSSCSLVVVDKIVTLFSLPFLISIEKLDHLRILKLYFECKLIPNLIYALKLIMKSTSIQDMTHGYDKNEINTMHSMINLMGFLVHRDNDFVLQFCDALCIFSMCENLQNLILHDIHSGITGKLLSILNVLLNHSNENTAIVDQILPPSNYIFSMFDKLIHHKYDSICIATCFLIGHCIKASCSFIPNLKLEHNLLSDLINLETNQNLEIQKSASFAVTKFLKFMNEEQ